MPIAEDPEPRPADDQAEDPFANLVLDEEFVKGATVKEASGRARFLTAKWKRQPPPEPEQWRPVTEIRRSRFGRRARRVDAWGRPVKRKNLNWQAPLFVVLAAAVTLAALNVDRLRSWYHSGDVDTASSALPTLGPETARPSAPPPSVEPDTPTVDHPWAGSPAVAWPEGADALALPAAQPVGAFGKDQVAADLQRVKDFLVAANIDPKTLAGATPQGALDLLNKNSRAMVETALAKPTKDDDPTNWISRFDPRLAVPLTDKVKVQGLISFEGDGKNGLLVHTDVTYVYALKPGPDLGKSANGSSPTGDARPVGWLTGSGADTAVAREIVRRTQDFHLWDPAHYTVDPDKLSLGDASSNMGGNICDMGNGYLQPDFPTSSAPGTEGPHDGPTVDPYDRSKALPPQDGKCGTSSRV